MPFEETYMEKGGYNCERCGETDKNRRILCISYRSTVYLCAACLKDMTEYLEAKITFTASLQWVMTRKDLQQWIDPAGRKVKPSAEHLKKHMEEWDDEMIELGKDLMKLDIDRNNFYLVMRKKIKQFFTVIDEYLKKTT